MSYTTLNSKTTGDAPPTRAEIQDQLDNIAWFRTRPAIRVYRSDKTNQVVSDSTNTTLAFNDTGTAGGQFHEEWIEPAADAATYLPNSGAYGSDTNSGLVNVGDVEQGIWLVGASGAFEPNGTGTRRVRLRRDGGSDVLHSEESFNAPTGRRVAFHQCTMMDFITTEDHFKCEVWQDSGGNLDIASNFQPPRFWALWLCDDASWSTDYADHWPASSDGLVDWWNGIRENQLRIQRRPTASMWRSSSQSISAGVQTKVVFNAEEHDTDGNQNDTTLGHITIAEDGWYLVDWGVKCVSLNTGGNTLSAILYRDSTSIDSQLKPIPDSSTLATSGQLLVPLTAGEELSVEVSLTVACTVGGDRATYLRAHNLSSDSGVSPNRQKFGPIPPAAEIPTVADLSSDLIPLSLMRLVSDLTDRMWHRPVVVLEAAEAGSVAVISNDDGWTDIPVTQVATDYTDLEGQGYTITGGGGTGAVIAKSSKAAGTGWRQQWCEPFVLEEGDTISIQMLTGNMSGDPGVMVEDAQLRVAEIGAGITRDAA